MTPVVSKGFKVVKDEDNGLISFVANLKELAKDKRIKVGVQGDQAFEKHPDPDGGLGDISMVDLYAVHEFGTIIKNGFGRGIEIKIPQRSSLRATGDANGQKYSAALKKIVTKMVKEPDRTNVDVEMLLLGERVRADVINRIKNRIPPPLKQSTIDRRKNKEDVPLIDEGLLIAALRVVVT